MTIAQLWLLSSFFIAIVYFLAILIMGFKECSNVLFEEDVKPWLFQVAVGIAIALGPLTLVIACLASIYGKKK